MFNDLLKIKKYKKNIKDFIKKEINFFEKILTNISYKKCNQ